jgi:nitrate reductase assembly molybdenum cofactor insertion protein NarJ
MNRELLREAAEWSLISLLLMPPEEDWEEQIVAIASEAGDPGLRNTAEAACQEADRALYHTLFGPGGVVRPRAVSHSPGAMPEKMLSQPRGFYQAFGYGPRVKEPPDHVAVMTGFVAYLRLKQAMGGPRQARKAAEALVRFIGEHLECPAQSLARDLEPWGVSYVACAAQALVGKVEGIKREISTK